MKRFNILLFIIFIVIYLLPLGGRPLFTPDETRYSEIAREMVASHNWVSPHLSGIRYFEKPVMGHWLNACALMIFGECDLAVRFFPAVTTGLTALLLFFLSRRYAGGRTATLSTAIFLSCGLVYFVGTYGVLDSQTTFFLTGTMTFFYFAYNEERFNRRKILLLVGCGIFCGAAFLTKGFLALAVPAAVAVPFLLWEKKWKQIFILPWIPLAAAVVTAWPWAWQIHRMEPGFWHYFFYVEHVQRFFKQVESQHPEPFWFFIPVVIVGLVPWIFLLPAIISGYRAEGLKILQNRLARYTVCWAVFPFIFFSASSGKLATYILPCFPPLALMVAVGLGKCFEFNKEKYFTVSVKVLMIMLAAVLGVFVIMQGLVFLGLTKFAVYGTTEGVAMGLALFAVLCWIAFLSDSFRNKAPEAKLFLFFIAPLACLFISHMAVPGLVTDFKSTAPGKFLLRYAERVKPDTLLITDKNLLSSVSWYYKRDNVYIIQRGGEMAEGLKYSDSQDRLISIEQFGKLVKKTSPGKVIFITNSKKLTNKVPAAAFKVEENGIFFWEY